MTNHYTKSILSMLLLSSALAAPSDTACRNRNNSSQEKLLECVGADGAKQHLNSFQDIADSNGGTRHAGSPGYEDSVEYVRERMERAGYHVYTQPFEFDYSEQVSPSTLVQTSPNTVTYVEGEDYFPFQDTPSGDVTASVTPVNLFLNGNQKDSTSGCELSEFDDFPAGNIALMQRGGCSFGQKAGNAFQSGASAVVVMNQGESERSLGAFNSPRLGRNEGFGPAVSISYQLGYNFAEMVSNESPLELTISTDFLHRVETNVNVFAESQGGDESQVVMVGAHLDSVIQGPGMNDNASGSASLLEIAEKLAKIKPVNKIRFAWWGAEELGLIGSREYLNNYLEPKEIEAISLYINVDMVASPNFAYRVWGGGLVFLENFFKDVIGVPTINLPMRRSSDHWYFYEKGIPTEGLNTGAGGIKTDEEVEVYGGVAGEPHDPCYHAACDTMDNINEEALDANVKALAAATLHYAMNPLDLPDVNFQDVENDYFEDEA